LRFSSMPTDVAIANVAHPNPADAGLAARRRPERRPAAGRRQIRLRVVEDG